MITLTQHIHQCRREYLAHVLVMASGNVTRAARIAGCSRTTFTKLLQRYNLNRASRIRWDLKAREQLSEQLNQSDGS